MREVSCYLQNLEVHVRLPAAMPLLIIAALATEARMRTVPQQLLERNPIPENAITHFEGAIGSTIRLRNSVLPEVVCLTSIKTGARREE